ncbi:MAG: hypothetical protein L0L18_06925 [Acidipropionibacterium jensenii]|nr:hypothetical protein [Acidipropionibacterium jensenii]
MPTLPEGTRYGTLTWQVIRAVGDTAQDPDRDPDATVIAGLTAVFTPTVSVMKDATVPVTIFANPITATFDAQGFMVGEDGQRGIRLIATDSPNLQPQGVQYKVVLSAPTISSQTLMVEVWADQTTDLTNAVVPSAGSRTRLATVIPSADPNLLPASTLEGDLVLAQDTSQLYQLTNATLTPIANLRGEKGEKGEKGDTGDVTPEAAQALADARAARSGAESAAASAGAARDQAATSATAAAQSATAASTAGTAAADARIDAALEPGGALRTPLDAGDAQTLAAAKAYVDQRATLVWDQTTSRYTNQSIVAMLASHADGLAYGVQIPKGSATACTKTGANTGIATPTPGVIGTPAIDNYTLRGPFFTLEVNGGVEVDGTPYVTAVQGDGRFARDGSNGDVWILTPNLYWLFDTSSTDYVQLTISDTALAGLSPQPKALLPGGGRRPYMLYAKYALSIVGGVARSVSGRPIANRNVSHNSLITQCKAASTGYAGKSYADDWYVKTMFLLKYATKNSQSMFAGVTSWNIQTQITVAESGTTRVIIATSTANNIPIGSSLMLGSNAAKQDRSAGTAFDVFDGLRVTRKESYDASNTAIYVNAAAAFNTTVGTYLSTAPWNTGACDAVVGDGSPTNRTNGREPFTVQGIELGLGMNEIVGDVILKSDGSTGWQIYTNPDSKNESTAVTANYLAPGKYSPSGASDAGFYPLYPDSAGGFLVGAGTGASQSTGLCDQVWSNGTAVTGEREWRSLGGLWDGGNAGLWFVGGNGGLTDASWYIGSRLSAVGRAS